MRVLRLKDNAEVCIREVSLGDLSEVYEIEKLSFKDPYPLDLLHTFAVLNSDTFLVAVKDGRVVGYVIGVLRWDVIGHILNIAVHPCYRRKGLGELLMREIMDVFRKKGARVFRLEVRVSNLAAQRLYEKLGFKKEYTIPNYYSDGEACYVMFKRD